jgi:hypothetical protein
MTNARVRSAIEVLLGYLCKIEVIDRAVQSYGSILHFHLRSGPIDQEPMLRCFNLVKKKAQLTHFSNSHTLFLACGFCVCKICISSMHRKYILECLYSFFPGITLLLDRATTQEKYMTRRFCWWLRTEISRVSWTPLLLPPPTFHITLWT